MLLDAPGEYDYNIIMPFTATNKFYLKAPKPDVNVRSFFFYHLSSLYFQLVLCFQFFLKEMVPFSVFNTIIAPWSQSMNY